MNINMKLDTLSIGRAIGKLKRIQRPLKDDGSGVLDALATEGAEEAQRGYGGWAVQVVPYPAKGGSTEIVVYGDMPAIAEFGAGNATLTPSEWFETKGLDVEVWAGSYSLYEGTGDYYNWKHWKFGGKWYQEVQPHLGMFQAKVHLIQNCANIVKEEMGF